MIKIGRFGNQMDQFLGALEFAKSLDRTLVLPHLISYEIRPSIQIPFDHFFQVNPLKNYTKVILMDTFMKHLAPIVWPKGKRVSFCYRPREGDSCAAKDGNPFGPFWDKFGVDFDSSEFYHPLGYDPTFPNHRQDWDSRFPADKYPVLAFTGAPGAFPVAERNVRLQKYLKWSDAINQEADKFIQEFKPNKEDKLLAIHLRIGSDFVTIKQFKVLFIFDKK
jgi:peptide-O-fucosyltransferase